MFNKDVVDVLTQLNGITNSVILKHPTTIAVSEAQDIQVSIDMKSLDFDAFGDIALKDSLSDLLNLIKLFPDSRKVTINENTISVSDGNMASSFIMDNIALMDAQNKDLTQFTKTENAPNVASFELSNNDIKSLKASTGVFKDLGEIIFTSSDGDINISLGATNKFNAKSNTFSVLKQDVCSKDFCIKIPVENFKMIPLSTYSVDVKYNSNADAYRILLKNKTIDGFKILLSVSV